MIPRRIHQVWIGGPVPPQWADLANTWKRHHPDWVYQLWTGPDSRAFVEARYPELLRIYDSFPYQIQRVDAVRYLLLHSMGGVYVDVDIECLRPIDALVSGQSLVMVREPPEHASVVLEGRNLSNAFMAAEPGHPFFGHVIKTLLRGSQMAVTHQDVFDATGPSMLERAFRQKSPSNVHVLDHAVIFPYPRETAELRALVNNLSNAIPLKISSIIAGAYAIHYWACSWQNLSGEILFNPDPHRVAGFAFFPRRDSVGFDLQNAGRNVPKLAKACAANEAAVAFNTDGFLKSRVRPARQWEQWSRRAGNEGLYIKRAALPGPLWPLVGVGR